jgi:hypothetical protein
MSFLTGTQTELLYSMPAAATAATAAATTVMTASNATTFPAYQLPAGFFGPNGGIGRSLLIKAGGWFTTSSTGMTQTISASLDAAAGTQSGQILGSTGAFTPTASITDGVWTLELMVTCASIGVSTSATLNSVGSLLWGTGNNAATATAVTLMMGAPQTPVTFNSTSAYYVELFEHWSVTTGAPTITCTNFMIFGCN